MSIGNARNIVIHRINTTREFLEINPNYGIEFDVRNNNGEICLSHNPIVNNVEVEPLEKLLQLCNDNLLIANVKESGIEAQVISLIRNYSDNFFLLDCEMPYIINNYKTKGNYLSIRYSNLESINTVDNFINYIKWIWVDTYDEVDIKKLNNELYANSKIVFVSPERWNKEINIDEYIEKLRNKDARIDFVMTDENNAKSWENNFFNY
tara:strand:+ start:723 stop:1346 length:624 start_codon:yes stop_codon:yes gene_type:complete